LKTIEHGIECSHQILYLIIWAIECQPSIKVGVVDTARSLANGTHRTQRAIGEPIRPNAAEQDQQTEAKERSDPHLKRGKLPRTVGRGWGSNWPSGQSSAAYRRHFTILRGDNRRNDETSARSRNFRCGEINKEHEEHAAQQEEATRPQGETKT